MLHGRHRQLVADHGRHLVGAETGRVDNDLGSEQAVGGFHLPEPIGPPADGGHRGVAMDARTQIPGPLGHGIGDTGGVDMAIVRIPEPTHQIMGFEERVVLLEFLWLEQFEVQPTDVSHAGDPLEFLETLLGMCQTQGPGLVVAHRAAGFRFQPLVERDAVLLQTHHVQAGTEMGQVTGRMPGGPGGQLGALHQGDILTAPFCQVIKGTDPGNTPTNNQDLSVCCHLLNSPTRQYG